ncbi:hypothetical protein PM082_016976 [Marasmius tenuissimus]|nr:hypothetical protein PM082_016976 [Marasmius tenuissimus]
MDAYPVKACKYFVVFGSACKARNDVNWSLSYTSFRSLSAMQSIQIENLSQCQVPATQALVQRSAEPYFGAKRVRNGQLSSLNVFAEATSPCADAPDRIGRKTKCRAGSRKRAAQEGVGGRES